MGLYGLTQLGVVFGHIGVGEAWPSGNYSCLDGLEPCGLYWENRIRTEVADKGLNTSEVVGAVGREQGVLCVRLGQD